MSVKALVAFICLAIATPAWQGQEQRPQPEPIAPSVIEPARNAYDQKDQSAQPSRPAPDPKPQTIYAARDPYGIVLLDDSYLGSTYISVDSWIYPAMLRLYSLGYLDTAFLGMRPWTRRSVLHMLLKTEPDVMADDNEQAKEILASLLREFNSELPPSKGMPRGPVAGVESGYARAMGTSGPVLRDSYHLGQSYINDYGRPYGSGFNTYDGFSALAEVGRFSLHVRGEYQRAAPANGYDLPLATLLASRDQISYSGYTRPQDTIPEGDIGSRNNFRLVDAFLSFHLLGHEISGGKMDNWMGPARGGSLAWSNNAENIYAFRINRVEPLHIPYLSALLGPVRYDFFVGSLKGHTTPNHPWVHSSSFAFAPTGNFQFGFQRTVIWGGADHAPVTLHTFLKSFFSLDDVQAAEKFSRSDPGARFSSFNFTWRLPYLTHWATLYADTFAHDDVTPISAPRRAAFRTGLYLSHFPRIPKLDMRVEAALTDPKVSNSSEGSFIYYETVQRQGYTNKGFIFGDAIGREGKGGQAWLTYHLSPNESVEFEYRNKKNAKDFILGGTTQNTFTLNVIKRIRHDLELNAAVSHEMWTAPIYKPGQQNLTTANFQIKWYPRLRSGSILP